MPGKTKETYHVGLREPDNLRRNILESSKGVIYALQAYERVKKLKGKKTELIGELNEKIKEIRYLNAQLKSKLPTPKHTELAEQLKKAIEKRAPKPKEKEILVVKKEAIIVQKPKSELEKLEDELRELEGKLNSLRA